MPKGPQGQQRPADTNACAVMVAKIATGEIKDNHYIAPNRVRSGRAGALQRIEKTTPEQRERIGREAARKRWGIGGNDE